MADRPIRILELRSVRGTGGGPEKTILIGTAKTDPRRYAITVCYLRDLRDEGFVLDDVAKDLPIDYVEIRERHSFDPAVWPALRRLVRDRRIDIVHAHEYKTDLLALALARAEGIIPLSTVHGWNGASLRETLVYYPADRQVLRWFPRVVAVSSAIRARLEHAGVRPDRITTVLNGVDVRTFHRDPARLPAARARLNLPLDATIVGGIGRLESEKRFDLLVDAVAELRRTRPDVHLVIAGTGSLEPELRQLADAKGIRDACTFAGHCGDIVDVYQALDVFVQSSDTEGTPNTVLEAMAMQVPIVATDVGGTSDLVTRERDGILVPRRDVGALVAAVERTLAQRDATTARVASARHRAEHDLSFDARMQAIERIYDQLFATRERSSPSVTAVA